MSGRFRATGRTDVCALPYGINTVSLFAYVFLVMLPAKLAAQAVGIRQKRAEPKTSFCSREWEVCPRVRLM